jgi:hypothetical protein
VTAAAKNLSPSVREFRVELESLERKKDQVDRIAKLMTEKWYFTRRDGVTLFADVTGKSTVIDRWTGTSEFDGRTWTRDESREGEIDYYIATVVFRPEWTVKRFGGDVDRELMERAKNGEWNNSSCRLMGVVLEPGTGRGAGIPSWNNDDEDEWTSNFEDSEEEEEDEEDEEDEEEDEGGDDHDGADSNANQDDSRPEGDLEGIHGDLTGLV